MANSCLSYMRARYYDPALGRFISEDPIGFEGGDVNLMRYVGNNPVRYIDPNGEAIGVVVGVIGGVVTVGAMIYYGYKFLNDLDDISDTYDEIRDLEKETCIPGSDLQDDIDNIDELGDKWDELIKEKLPKAIKDGAQIPSL